MKQAKFNSVQDEWNKRAQRPGLQSVMSSRWSEEECQKATALLKKEIFDILGDLSGTKVLEIGCGIGRFTKDLAKKAVEVHAIDICPLMLKKAAKRIKNKNVYFLKASSSALPFPANSFDLIFEVTVFQHIHDAKTFNNSVKQLKRVLKPGGRVFLCGVLKPTPRKSYSSIYRTVKEYKAVLYPLKLLKKKRYLCIEDPYTLMLFGS